MQELQDKDLVWFDNNLDDDAERLEFIELLLASSPQNESLQRAHKLMLNRVAENLLLGNDPTESK
jgi:hypothetical protein